MYLPLDGFLKSHELMNHSQSAYKCGHSTETAIIDIQNNILRNMEEGRVCVLILLDLSAAFDLVNHNILLEILEVQFGFRQNAKELLASYLNPICSGLKSNRFARGGGLRGPPP